MIDEKQEKREFVDFVLNILEPKLSKEYFIGTSFGSFLSGAYFFCKPRKVQYCFYRYMNVYPACCDEDYESIDYRRQKAKGLSDEEILNEIIKYFNIEEFIEKREI